MIGVAPLGDGPHRIWMTLVALSFSRDVFFCQVSLTELSRLCDRSTDVVDAAIKKLVESGFIEIVDQGGPGQARRYRVNLQLT